MYTSQRRVQRWLFPVCGVALIIGSAALVRAHLASPPPGYSGAPGEETCGASGCHTPPAIPQSPNVSIQTTPLGADTVVISVTTTNLMPNQGVRPYGFQVTLLDTTDQPVGEIVLTDTVRTQILPGANGRTYVSHTVHGVNGDICVNCEKWSFKFVRPVPPVDWVVVYGAGCIGDGDSSAANDEVVARVVSFGLGGSNSCLVVLTGDVNGSNTITSADIIRMAGYVFRGGAPLLPCNAAGDVNCDGVITASDIIRQVNFVFKAGQPPCDACTGPMGPGCV